MRKILAFFAIAAMSTPLTARAQLAVRRQSDQRGNFALIGNTLGFDCATMAGIPAPVVGAVGNCGDAATLQDSAPDVFWRADSPSPGLAEANISLTATQARSTAVLALPSGARITFAQIYWAAEAPTNAAGTQITLERPGVRASAVHADASLVRTANNEFYYQSTADVTAFVRDLGNGAYRVSVPTAISPVNRMDNNWFGAWSMVVFYQLASEPPRNLTLFDGAELVDNGAPSSGTIQGFLAPAVGFDARLGVVAYEGDVTLTGDALLFNGTALTNALNPADNFFNSTRTSLGTAVSVAGDLPRLTGGPGSMTGVDLDVVDISGLLHAGDTSATFQATSSSDFYMLGVFVTAISTQKPIFTETVKRFSDLTRAGAIIAGDTIEYTISTQNTGSDTGVDVVLSDVLPTNVTYVPSSIVIASGANAGAKTDAAGDDQAEYVAATRTVRVRLGTGANAVMGGTVTTADPPITVRFRVTINPGATLVSNQAQISASGAMGALQHLPPVIFVSTDGGGTYSPPTVFPVDGCATDAQCTPAHPRCDTSMHPFRCTACTPGDCTGTTPICLPSGACAACNGDQGSTASLPCPTAGAPFCEAGGACGRCTGSGDCAGRPGRPECDLATGACVPGCRVDTDCPPGQWCPASALCAPKAGPGRPVPSDPPIGGVCTPANGARGCLSGVCDTADNLCGDPNGHGCGMDSECRSNVCAADHRCGRDNGGPCASPVECRSGICDADGRCGRPNPGPCGAGAECRSAICVDADHQCGLPGGEPCSTGQQCRAGVCALDQHCGAVNGTPCLAGTSCRSGVCKAGLCSGGGCSSDADCAPGNVCSSSHTCGPPAGNGAPCLRGAECVAGVCGSDHLCGVTDGSPCSHGSDCRSGRACAGTPPTCGRTCTADDQCGPLEFCRAGACVPRQGDGPCQRGTECLAGICGPGGECGVPIGWPCAGPGDCRSGSCGPTGTCTSTCSGDRDCASSRFCDLAQKKCVPVAVGGGACTDGASCGSYLCASDMMCGGTAAAPCGADLVCRVGVCYSGDTLCGVPNGGPCDTAGVCRGGVCFSDKLCGKPSGNPCSANTECRSNLCAPSGSCARCTADSDCPGEFCDLATGSCGSAGGSGADAGSGVDSGMMAQDAGGSAPALAGGGFACTALGAGRGEGSRGSPLPALVLMLAAAWWRRRRRG